MRNHYVEESLKPQLFLGEWKTEDGPVSALLVEAIPGRRGTRRLISIAYRPDDEEMWTLLHSLGLPIVNPFEVD